jgi:DNA-binding NarL/FixJ family response regulator
VTTVLALVSDLFFGSKVAATARAHGVDYRGARSREAMRNPAISPSLVIVDLEAELPDGDALETIADALGREPRPVVVAFAGHLLADRLEAARQAGADLVLTKGGFTGRLEAMMAAAARGELPRED